MTPLKALGTALVLAGTGGAQFVIFGDPAHDGLVFSGLILISLGFMTLAWAEHIIEIQARRARHDTWRRQITSHWLPGV